MRRKSAFPSPSQLDIGSNIDIIRRAFGEFLFVPTLVISGFVLMALGAFWFEHSGLQIYPPIRTFLSDRIFVSAEVTSDMLSTIAGSIITVTSITTTLLLLIVQQSASTMTTQVFDQFLRRRSNQIYFGYFIGLALYTLITLATVKEEFNPVFAAAVAFILTVIALYLLILIFYATIHQMRPPVIIEAIHDHTIKARESQQKLIQRTRRESTSQAPLTYTVRSIHHGFVTWINLDLLKDVTSKLGEDCEIILLVGLGAFVSYHDVIAEIRLQDSEQARAYENEVRRAVHLERSRDITHDPAFGIQQLEIIAWSATSPAKATIVPGIQAVYSLRNLLARWAEEKYEKVEEDPLPIVYQDGVIADVFGAFEALAIIATQSSEFQVVIKTLDAFSILYPRLPQDWQEQLESTLLRILPTLSKHYYSKRMDDSLTGLAETMSKSGRNATVAEINLALNYLKQEGQAS
jgi:uncharacterized membrane protein